LAALMAWLLDLAPAQRNGLALVLGAVAVLAAALRLLPRRA